MYESRGFLSPRRIGPLRRYTQADCDRMGVILKAKRLGFTLREIGEVLARGASPTDCRSLNLSRRQCTEQINLLERQKRAIEDALAELRRTYSDLYLPNLEAGETGKTKRPVPRPVPEHGANSRARPVPLR